MVCEKCGSILREGARICDQCGAEIAAVRYGGGASGRRQGREDRTRTERMGSAVHMDGAQPFRADGETRRPSGDAARPNAQRGIPRPPTPGARPAHSSRRKHQRPMRRKMVNWALVWLIVIVLIVLLAGGGLIFLKLTDKGQLILARMGKDANATALWTYGQEMLDQGYVERSIEVFEAAYEKEPEREDLYAKLEVLAEAYEAANRTPDAERVYTILYTDVDSQNPAAYREMMRLLEANNRQMELAAFLQMAYEKTGDTYFRRQRDELLPSTPTADIEAGSLLRERDVQLLSAEDYEIYFILDGEGILPEDGTLYETPIHLDEGPHVLRAVAVSSNLVSDELRIQYTINLPVPVAPVTTLQPGEYNKRYKIGLKYVPTEEEALSDDPKQKEITIYYTVDGQTPTSNSPIFTGENFMLPAGRSTVKAVAVNGYGKPSNVMERTYKVNVPIKEGYFKETDNFADFTVMTTTRDAFVRKFGAPQTEENILDAAMSGDCVRLTYSWGEARFTVTAQGQVVYAVETDSASMAGPRKTKIGMSETDVTGLYRDMGQAHNQDGGRSLYYDSKEKKYGMVSHLDGTHDRIDYSYMRTDEINVTLSYHLENGRVVKMSIQCRYTGE